MVDGSGLSELPLKLPDHRNNWPDHLRPLGEGGVDKESFSDWWARNREELAHLPADLCEQWIFRHWQHSPFTFLSLGALLWERRTYDGDELLRSVYRAFGGDLEPQFDYETFHRRGGANRHPTAVALDSGTWDYPMVLLSTPRGIIDLGQRRRNVELVIVEGHQRHRYLNALHALGRPPRGPHQVIVLSTHESGSN